MRIAAVQMDIVWHDRETNHEKARQMASAAKAAGADLLIFPEMFSTGFSMDTSVTAEPLTGSTPTLLRTMARDLDLAVVGGFVLDRDPDRPQNVSLAVDRKGMDLALYPKIHQIAILNEDRHYDPGTLPMPFELEGMGAACFVCYDLRFPELFRAVVDQCAMILVIASWPASRQLHWDILLQARAIESQCYVVGVNRVGRGGGLDFTGGSVIIDPTGRIVAHAGDQDSLLVGDITPSMVPEVRSAMPFLKDRQQRLFQALARAQS
jgi:predicted amidohydrolase